jgi:hypothetical protein
MVQNNQPMGFRGRREAITTPTKEKEENASVYQASPEGGRPFRKNSRQPTPPDSTASASIDRGNQEAARTPAASRPVPFAASNTAPV